MISSTHKKMMDNKRLFSVFLVLLGLLSVECSHFRGGYITWKPSYNDQIEISYRIAFRRSYSSNHFCDQDTISNGNLVAGEGYLNCLSGCTGTISNMSYYCTDFSLLEDWSMGIRTVKYTPPASSSNVFQFGYGSCCWITLVNGGSNWRLMTEANLEIRADKGTPNSSPLTAMQPIIRYSHGCNYKLRIPVADDDGDIVRCRWALHVNNECGGVCESFPGYLDENECTLEYNATGRVGWYAVALQIEDFRSASDNAPLSSIPLQFLVFVSYTNSSCSEKPELPDENTLTDGSEHQLSSGSTFNQTIVAKSSSETNRITEINTVSPQGMTKTELVPHGTSGLEWSVQVVWKPTPDQAGSHVFCYSAVDSSGQTSDQSCSTLVVDGETTSSGNILGLDATCSQPKDPNDIEKICSNAETTGTYYFQTSCSDKFLECTTYGTGYIMTCPAGLVWCQNILTCATTCA